VIRGQRSLRQCFRLRTRLRRDRLPDNVVERERHSLGPGSSLCGGLTDGKSTHRFCVGMRLPFHEIIFDVPPEFVAKHISAIFPKCLTARRSDEVHDDMLPPHPQRRREQSFAPLQKRILRIREERHEGRDKTNSLLFGKGSVVTQPLRNDLGKLIIGGDQVVPFGEVFAHRLRGGRPTRRPRQSRRRFARDLPGR